MAVRSLQGHFAVWLGGTAVAVLFVGGAIAVTQAYLQLADAQDMRLAAAAEAGRASDARVPPYPWPAELPASGTRLYFGEVDGGVVRAAVAGPAAVAEPLSNRIPSARAIFGGWFGFLALGAAIGLGSAWLCWLQARRFLTESAELQPTLHRLNELQAQQQDWVDEQRRFLAEAAHQLRTPMAVLRAQLQEALHAGGDVRSRLEPMLDTVDRATTVANQLLSLSRAEQLRRGGALQRVSTQHCVREALIELAPLVSAKRLEFALDGEDFEADADPVMLGELVRNLLGNAIHHTPEGGHGGVVLRPAPACEIIVWDEGPGIDDELKPRLFVPFSAGRGGVGLGLSICRQVAEAMGARVTLYNRVVDDRVSGVDAVVKWAP